MIAIGHVEEGQGSQNNGLELGKSTTVVVVHVRFV